MTDPTPCFTAASRQGRSARDRHCRWRRWPASRTVLALAAALTLLQPAAAARAQEAFPTRPLTFIVPFAPGADTDNSARLIAQGVEAVLRQPVVIVNRTGAGGRIGINAGAAAAPDGYTVTVATPSVITQPMLSRRDNVRVLDRFEAVALPAGSPLLFMTPGSRPWANLREFIAFARANPGRVNFANPGEGSFSHLIPLMLEVATGTSFTHIPYRGGGPATVALLNREVDGVFVGAGGVQGHLQSGELRALAIGTPQRYALIPNVPTFAEAGLEIESITWWGYMVPKGTPADRVAILAGAIRQASEAPNFREAARRLFWLTDFYGPEEFTAYIRRQEAAIGPIVERMLARGALSQTD
jgi:tripartite-type tricarboxylate transporter receptor subunit TctC